MKKLLLLILLGICLFTNICFAENKEQNTTNSNIATDSNLHKEIVLEDMYDTLKLSKISDKIITINGIDYNKYKYEATTTWEKSKDWSIGFEDKQETFRHVVPVGSGVTLIPVGVNLDDLRF